jgi:N-acetylglucosamine malate deacetylase 1
MGVLDRVPPTETARKAWLAEHVKSRLRKQAERFREVLIRCYGASRAGNIEYAEAFEPCEYGSRLDETARQRLFPFVDK